ncbi:MAG: YnfA family protein [Anaerolineae bacterium]|nr:YnfA family protein [Anaerolineae bacterium]
MSFYGDLLEMLIFALKTISLFVATAFAEIIGCYLTYLVLKESKPLWWLFPATLSIGIFVWLLTFHPGAAGRTYAAYGGVYVTTAIFWLWLVEHQTPTRWDVLGGFVIFLGMSFIILAPRT